MFINCPYCRTLVATDPVTDQPPSHCPQCHSLLRRDGAAGAHDAYLGLGATGPTQATSVDAVGHTAGHAAGSMVADTPGPQHRNTTTPVAVDDPADAAALRELDQLLQAPVTDLGDLLQPAPPRAAPAPPAADENIVRDLISGALDPDRPSMSAINDATDADAADATATAGDAAPPPEAARSRRARFAPSFARGDGTDPRRWHGPVAIAVIVLLLVLLAVQWLLADRARLAVDAGWRPLLSTLCGALGCDLPPWREPTAFTLLQRDVRQHPSLPGVLRVTADFRNDARWSQPWPELQLTLSDVNGLPAGQRSFRAREYLGGTPEQLELSSGESVSIAMDVVEPAARIVAFDFRFR